MPTKIEWCDETLNPLGQWCYGPGGTQDKPNRCIYCYAKVMASRGMQSCPQCRAFTKHHHLERLEKVEKWKYPRNIFIQSMGDLFHDEVPDEWIQAVFAACGENPRHNYLFLTKNWMRACEYRYKENWWIGRTITHAEPCENTNKNLHLCYGVPKSVEPVWKDHPNRFISVEPIHGPIPDLPYYAHEYGYKWVIVGAETGNSKGKVVPQREWIEKIVEDCAFRKVPLFMKDSLAAVWGEPLIQEYPPQLQPRPAPRPKRRIPVKRVLGMEYCDECGAGLQGKPAVRLGVKRYECMTCYEKLEAEL